MWALGTVSFLTDAASEMIVPLLPVFVAGLGGGALALGAVEGVAGAVASVLKLLAGRWSDRLGRSLPFVVAGYGLSSFVRPLVALASVPWHVVAVRALDRVGKGLRGSPRDAILARAVAPSRRGAAFGIHRAFDHAGAAAGPLIAVGLLLGPSADVRTVFWASAAPGLLAVAVLVAFVREPPTVSVRTRTQEPGPAREGAASGGPWRFLAPYAAISLASVTELFLLLRLGAVDASLPVVGYPLAWLGIHAVKTVAAAAGGSFSDRVGRRAVLALAWTAMAVAFGILAASDDPAVVTAALGLYALQAGAADGVWRAWVADVVPRARLGTGFGWFHFVEGALALAASVWFGFVWDRWSGTAAFAVAAGLCGVAVLLLLLLRDGVRSGAGDPG